MAARGQTRVNINRDALHEIDLAMAKGLEALGREVLRIATPPDTGEGYYYQGAKQQVPDARPSPRRGEHRAMGEGLVDRGGYLSYVDGKRVGGDPEVRRKPKAFLVRGKGAAVAVGYGFPARFQETGTEHQPARPFLGPAVMQVVGSRSVVENALREALSNTLQKQRRRNLRSSLGDTKK